MALARKCDICGKFYDEYKNENALKFLNVSSDDCILNYCNKIDCCPECMESIKKHIDSLGLMQRKRSKMIEKTMIFPEWIYNPVNDPMWNNLFQLIEEALGFKLFFWQKTYIMGLGYRRSGETTADILKALIGDHTSTPIYLGWPKSPREDFYQRELIEIKRKLDARGLISRSVERRK